MKRTTIWTVCWTSPDYLIENIFLEICPEKAKKLADAGWVKLIYLKRADFEAATVFPKENRLIFYATIHCRRNQFFFTAIISGWVSHNEKDSFDYVGWVVRCIWAAGIDVRIIFIFAPQNLHVILALCFSCLTIMIGLNRRISCNNLMSFLLHGCRNP